MKAEYKNITGIAIKGYYCDECCFVCLAWDCIPITLHRCVRHIFKESDTQIFKL